MALEFRRDSSPVLFGLRNELNDLTCEYNRYGSFIIFPGYELSGNTGLRGHRNVLFMREGEQIHRSSHALVDEHADLPTDANSATPCAGPRAPR